MNYILATAFLYLSHVIPSSPKIRQALLHRLGKKRFRIAYSVLSSFAAVWFIAAYVTTEVSGFLWTPLPGIVHLALFLMPLSFLLMIGRISTPFGEIVAPEVAKGIYRFTRFPGSLGILLWAVLHLLATGDLKRVIAFGCFALIALSALIKNERDLRRQSEDAARRFLSETSLIPFAGFGSGGGQRGHLKAALVELGWRRPLAALLLTVLVLLLHPLILGVDPLAQL